MPAAIGERAPFRLRHRVHVVRASPPVLLDRSVFQHVEDLNDEDAAGAWWAHSHDLVAPKRSAHRIAIDRAIRTEVLERDQARAGLHLTGDESGRLAVVEAVPPVADDALQRAGEILLNEHVPGMPVAAVGADEDRRRTRVLTQARALSVESLGKILVDGEPLTGETDRGGEKLRARHAPGAVVLPESQQAVHRAGNTGGEMALE